MDAKELDKRLAEDRQATKDQYPDVFAEVLPLVIGVKKPPYIDIRWFAVTYPQLAPEPKPDV